MYKLLKVFLALFIIASTILIADKLVAISEQKEAKEQYALWRACITLSDYTDLECEECDAVHNPNNLDFDMDSTKVTFKPRKTIKR